MKILGGSIMGTSWKLILTLERAGLMSEGLKGREQAS